MLYNLFVDKKFTNLWNSRWFDKLIQVDRQLPDGLNFFFGVYINRYIFIYIYMNKFIYVYIIPAR